MNSLCGINCDKCEYFLNSKCKGCHALNGCPFNKECFIAKYISIGGKDKYEEFKNKLIDEFNEIDIPGMPKITDLNALIGEFVNLEYRLPNGKLIKFLEDDKIYLGTQVECEFNDENNKKCFGLVANLDFLLICQYKENGECPELIIYKKR